MPRRIKKKLLYQFLFFILPFIVLSIVTTSIALSLANNNFFQKTVHQDYRNILKSSAGEIRLFMDNALRNLESLALLIVSVKMDDSQKEIALTGFLQTNTQFATIDLFSVSREKIISGSSGNQPVSDSDRELVDRAFSGQVAISGVILSENDIPYISIAVPVFRLGTVDEVLMAELNLKAIWDVLEKITIGDTGQVYVMDVSGRIIAHRDIDRVVRMLTAEQPEIVQEIRSAQAPVEWIENKQEGSYYNLGAYVPGLDWIVVLRQPGREVYAYLYQNIYLAAFITVLISLAAVLVGWNRIRRILSPIQTLHRQVQLIGQGNLDQKVTIKAENEIGDLGIAFNEMTDSLKEYIDREVETAKALAHAQNLALLGTASSKMTHEVGNFLNNTHMALSGLKREELSQRGEKILKILERESFQVNEFIRKFLQFAKKPVLNIQNVPLDRIIMEILTIIRPEAQKRGIEIELNWDAEIPQINIDGGLMSQVMNNLLKNSIEAMPGAGTITVTGSIDNENLVITVTDTGEGIAAENAEKIFEPFFTTKGTRGTGLGMSIVKSNVEAHGGTIECTSEPGKGTTFIIRLPAR